MSTNPNAARVLSMCDYLDYRSAEYGAANPPRREVTAYMRARCEVWTKRLLPEDALAHYSKLAGTDSERARLAEEYLTMHEWAEGELSALAALCEGMEDAQYAAWKAEEGR